jgi:type I restriction enzyme S subunit
MAPSLPYGTTAPRGLPTPEQIRWPLVAGRDLFELRYGKALVESNRRPGRVPVYGTNGRCGNHDEALFKGPGVILGRKGQGPLGVEWSDDDYWVIDTAYSLAPLRPDIDLRYAYFLIKLIGLNHLKDGTSNPTLSRDTFGAQALPLPPLDQQRAIAHILGTLDAKIELNRRMNETLEAMARALFQSWFVDFDPVRAKAEGRDPGLPKPLASLFPDSFEDSDLEEIPKGWAIGRFGEVVEQVRDQENPLASPDALFHHFSIPAFDEGQSPKPEYGESVKSLKLRVPPGVVLLSKLNPEIERVWMVDVRSGERAVCSTEFLVLHARSPFTRSYVYCLTRSPLFRKQIEGLVTGTSKSHQRAQVDSILNLAVVVPPSPIVSAFDHCAAGLLARTLECRRGSLTLSALRDTLLPKLISGQLRVKDANHVIGGDN